MNFRLILAALAALALVLTGCSTPIDKASSPTTPSATATSAAPAPSTKAPSPSATAPAPAPSSVKPSTPSTYNFGATVKWETGISLTVSAPTDIKPGKYVSGADQKDNLLFTITLTNGSAKVFDPSMARATMSSAGVEASDWWDSSNNISGSPDTKVLPGKSVTWKLAFSVADANDLVMEIAPDFTHESALFVSGA